MFKNSLKHFLFSFLIISLLQIIGVCSLCANDLDSLLNEIDVAIKNQDIYIQHKENQIQKLQYKLEESGQSNENKYIIYTQLVDEYEAFQSDSLEKYSKLRLSTAVELNNNSWITDSKINLALVEAKKGFFQKSEDILNNLNRSDLSELQTRNHLMAYYRTYVYWIEYFDGYDVYSLIEEKQAARDSLIMLLPTNSFDYAECLGVKYMELGEYNNAESILKSMLPQLASNDRNYAVFTSLLANLYERNGDIEKQKEYLALSALTDIRGAILENTSLRTLALLLFNEGDFLRANTFVKKSMEDANIYNARLRNYQTAKILPVIDKAYEHERIKQHEKLKTLIIVISLLTFLLLMTLIFLALQMKNLSKAQKNNLIINAQLKELNLELQKANQQQFVTNRSLIEANHLKENFIRNFLEICTEYIGKLEKLKQTVHRKLKVGQMNDILRLTSPTVDSSRELKELYENFDRAFLNIYPSFVEEFNRLLRPDEQYTVQENKLNQELRIFALIRLGINDNNKIATFLHYTLRTIYNYRSKVKSKAINQQDDFEESIRLLCSK